MNSYYKGLFLCSPVGLDLLKGLAGGLRDALPHYEEVRDAHRGEEEEGAGRGERLQHPRGELADQVGADPEGEAGLIEAKPTSTPETLCVRACSIRAILPCARVLRTRWWCPCSLC